MDITLAKEKLINKIQEDKNILAADELALSILNETFEAEFTSIEVNRKITEEKVALVAYLTTRLQTAESAAASLTDKEEPIVDQIGGVIGCTK
jgi:hypothetical protein